MSTNSTSSPRILMALTVAGLLAVGCSTLKSGNGPTGGASTNSPISATGASSTSPDSATTALSPTTLLASQARVVQPSVTPAPSAKPVPPKPVTPEPVATATTRTAAQVPQAPTIAPGTGQTTTLTGLVMQIDSTGDFDLTYGNVRLRIVMQPTTVVLNLRGKEVIRPYIQPSNNVQVTGPLVGTTLTAQTVVVQTTKDGV